MATLDAILSDVSAMLDITLEVDSANLATGALKTWYFTFQGRETGATETPANTTFDPFLRPSSFSAMSQGLAEDFHFSGLAKFDPGVIALVESSPRYTSKYVLAGFLDYTFAGYAIRIKVVRVDDLYAEAAIFRTVRASDEPVIELVGGADSGLQARFKVESLLDELLAERMQLPRYVGIPHALKLKSSSGYVSRAHNAIYNLTSFTLTGRFRVPTAGITGSAQADLQRKFDGATQKGWQVWLGHASNGSFANKVYARFTTGTGGVFTYLGPSTATYNDDKWHVWAVGVQAGKSAFLMVDGDIIQELTTVGTPDTPTASILMGGGVVGNHFTGGAQNDLRIYSYYLSPDAIRARTSTRTDGSEDGPPIALWIHDDNTGANVNDYSASALDATIAGTVTTDYEWVASYLGTPEIAGRQYPYTIGVALNAPVQIIDPMTTSRGIGRWGDIGTSPGTVDGLGIISSRSRGTLLTGGGTDYSVPTGTGADAVIDYVAAEDEPLTFSHEFNTPASDEFQMYASLLAQFALTDGHTSLSVTSIMNLQTAALTALCPWLSGAYFDREVTAGEVLQVLLGNNGLSYREDREGNILFDFLTPPLGPGPYGEPCLDFAGWAGNVITWPDSAALDIAGSMTIAFWFSTSMIDQTANALGTFYVATKGSNYSIYFELQGTNSGRFGFTFGGGGAVYSPYGLVEAGKWYFVALVFDDAANTSTWYVAEEGASLASVSSSAQAGTPVANTNTLVMGSTDSYSWGSVQHLHIWNVTKNLAALQTLMTTPPVGNEANLKFYAPLNEGTGAPIDLVSSVSGSYGGSTNAIRWAPKLKINLTNTPSVTMTEFRRLRPVSEIVVKYAHNYRPLTPTEFDTGVSSSTRLDLGREWKEVVYRNESTTLKRPQRVVMETSIAKYGSALRLLSAMVRRLSSDVRLAKLTFPSGLAESRIACGLNIGDEVEVTSFFGTHQFKVIAVAPNPITLSTEIIVWWGEEL